MNKFSDLRDFIKFLEKNDDLKIISKPISSDLEITEISKRALEKDAPALLFINVDNQSTPVLTNLFASKRRIIKALGLDDEQGLRKLGELLAF